jgi:exodeoxyribonuclease VII small subunit
LLFALSELGRKGGAPRAIAPKRRQKREAVGPEGNRVNQPAPKKPEPPKKPDFERSLARLEEVVRRLESPQLSLDEAMKLFEEGVALSRECQKRLEEAEGRVEILLKKADGKLAAEPLEPEGQANS